MKKKILSFILAFVCLITCGICFTACGNEGMTNTQIYNVLNEAATNYFGTHKDIENYSSITYHFVETETTKIMKELNYKENAEDQDYVTGSFEDVTIITTETTVAVKKEGEHLVSETTIVTTTNEKTMDTDLVDETLLPVDNTTVETSNYRMFHYDEGTKNIILYEKTSKTNDEDTILVEKKYSEKKSENEFDMNSYDDFCEEFLIFFTNRSMNYSFFSFSEALLAYNNILKAQQNGNEIMLNLYFNYIDIDSSDWYVINCELDQSAYFKDGNIWKYKYCSKETSENYLSENIITFDYSNTANVNMELPTDLTEEGYTFDSVLLYGGYDYCYSSIIGSLPKDNIF